ncbi:glycosyltransferase [Mucilaginibacter arboris]|uniref:Glycosyltransferase n=1 Tax=Mucilaginibacter arboris TaxID=2682090 RepID=A0A7K1SRS0_9SPHI|nr:glycosyltransferase [Mucilaginibacter arboris]MVN20016.1 glycosyltransferase [Mucilaginibacter arboris]
MADKQIFQTDSPGRWNRLKWLSRTLIIILILSAIAAVITISSQQYPSLPNLIDIPKKLSQKELDQVKKSKKFKEIKLDVRQIKELARNRKLHQLKHPNNKNRLNVGFFWPWDPQSFTSLTDHISKMDMVISESFSISPGTDTLKGKLEPELTRLVQKNKKPVIAIIENLDNGNWDTKTIQAIVKSKTRRTKLINNILTKLVKYNIKGVDIHFEDIANRNDKNFVAFEKELYTTLHAKNYLVMQQVVPNDDEYDLKLLQNYCDYLIVMAFNDGLTDSDISDQHDVESILDNICSQVPSEKVILTVAALGYDWPENSAGKAVTYQEAIQLAQEHQSKIKFSPESANLTFTYTDLNQIKHKVYFTDAATNFNIIRMADDWATGGVALWRLGSEDSRIWNYFAKNLSIDSLRKTGVDTARLTRVGMSNRVDYTGDGEVLDLVSTPTVGRLSIKLDPKTFMIQDQNYIQLPTKYVIRRYGYSPKKVVLTFDDGPDPIYTPQILAILKREHVPAAFFVVGSMAEKSIPLLREEFNDGYEIGNHTYLHPDVSTISLKRVILELNATRRLIEAVTGRSTILFRPPFNADAEPQNVAEVIPVEQSRKENYINIGESIDPNDWQPGVTADTIVARAIALRNKGSMILLHDAGGDTRQETVKALPRIIDYYKKHGYQFTTIAKIIGKTKDEVMPVIHDDATSVFLGRFYSFFILSYFYGNWFLFYVFLIAIFLALGRIILVGVLALRQFSINKKTVRKLSPDELPPVSIIVPGYNEEVTVLQTISSLLKINYSVFEIIFVDDGSKDRTLEIVTAAYGNHPQVKIFTKPNGGKATALNYGIKRSMYNFAVCIDADTQLQTDAVYHLMTYFTDEEIGAVAGTVKVGNEVNLITRWQSIEYITAQNMDRRAFDLLNSITVVPGAIGAFRKEAIEQAGGFTSDTLAEDCDLTMRILKEGYIIRNCGEAIAYTEAPETIEMLVKQRFRWSFGVMQSFWKHRKALLNPKYRYFGMVGMPNILIFQIILPLFSPLADLMMIASLFGGDPGKMLIYYLVFVLVDLFVGVLAFKMEKEDYRKLIYIIPQRFMWRQLMYYVLFKSVRKALKGELHGWGNLKRTGTVSMQEAKI